MPYALSNIGQGATAYAAITAWNRPISGDWWVRIKFSVNSTASNQHLVGRSDSSAGSLRVATGGILRLRDNGSDLISSASGAIVAGTIYDVKFGRSGSNFFLEFVGGASVGTATYAASQITNPMNQLMRFSSTLYGVGVIYEVETSGGTYNTLLNGSNAPSTGTTWTDGVATATATNFTGAADSWWLLYGATGYTLTADGASWEYSGADASLLFDRQLSADGAAWQYQGGSASTLYGRSMQADGVEWSYAGGIATLTYTGGAVAYFMIADGASWDYSGADAALLANRRMTADGSSWQYQLADASLLLHRKVSADGSSWQYSFAPAILLADRRLSASGTSYAYSGGAASLNYSGAVTLQINGYTVSYSESAVSAAFGASPVTATYTENLRAEYGNV